jgi:hypothetical protein
MYRDNQVGSKCYIGFLLKLMNIEIGIEKLNFSLCLIWVFFL